MKVSYRWKLSSIESYLVMKGKMVKEVKRSDGLWRFACGDVFKTNFTQKICLWLIFLQQCRENLILYRISNGYNALKFISFLVRPFFINSSERFIDTFLICTPSTAIIIGLIINTSINILLVVIIEISIVFDPIIHWFNVCPRLV